jgi:O-methyltransferase/8-demethyl-8-(2,3-dimethoxy-alpha-L-rhamnosyl)tetracenomycin-C 4'-O-methyltransferase
VLRLDGDMYGSTIESLDENLYPKLSVGGFAIIDDYALNGCRAAVYDNRAARGVDEPIETVDWCASFWQRRQ